MNGRLNRYVVTGRMVYPFEVEVVAANEDDAFEEAERIAQEDCDAEPEFEGEDIEDIGEEPIGGNPHDDPNEEWEYDGE